MSSLLARQPDVGPWFGPERAAGPVAAPAPRPRPTALRGPARLAGQIRLMRAGGMSARAIRRALGLSAREAVALGLAPPAEPGRATAGAPSGAPPAPRPGRPAGPTMAAVLEALAAESGLQGATLLTASQVRPLVRLRHLLMWLLRELCGGASLPAIGHFLGRDHTSVLYGCRCCRRRLAEDPALAALAAGVKARLARAGAHG